ncbi:MAG: PH domain-containing protein [Arenimonas sp.]
MGILDQLLGNASERNLDKLQEEFGPLLAPGETLVKAYAVIRDLFVFTDRRLILSNKQGITGSKVEYLNIPYRSIVMFTFENAGHFDMESELCLHIASQLEPIRRTFGRSDSTKEILALLAQYSCK